MLRPLQEFARLEASGGLVLLAATIVALAWANIDPGGYASVWGHEVTFHLGSFSEVEDLQAIVNDGLMTIFFLVVGLEVKRELVVGELSSREAALLPAFAAVGGMILPVLIFLAVTAGGEGSNGWGIPMATDVAFAIAALVAVGARAPSALVAFLLGVAVIDDIGAILVIAIFYSGGLAPDGLILVGAGIAAVTLLKAGGVRMPSAYVVPGVLVWAGMYRFGIHPTLAGVVLGLLTPVREWKGAPEHVDSEAPAVALQHALHRWVAFAIMPIFALANAGVGLGGASFDGDAAYVFWGTTLGLAIGKPVGIFVVSRVSIRAGVAICPRDVSRAGLGVVGVVAGIGFTMSLFIAQLAFPPGPLLETAKLGILVGSLAAAVVGLGVGRALLRPGAHAATSEAEAEGSTHL